MMKRRVFGMLLSLCLVLALIPAAAFAEDGEPRFTLEVPYTTTVKQGGSAAPGKTYFYVEMIKNTGNKWMSEGGVEITCPAVDTNGVGSYDGKVIIKITDDQGWSQLADGVFVRQQNKGEDGWEYDERVWCVKAGLKGFGDGLEVFCDVYPTEYKNGEYIPLDSNPPKEMTFTDTYTKSEPEVTPVPSDPTNPGEDTSAPDVTNLPKTGDSSNLTGWLILLAVSAAAVAGAAVYSRRRKNARE